MKAKLGVKHKIPGPDDKNESESDRQKSIKNKTWA